jgi:hypothetical protein
MRVLPVDISQERIVAHVHMCARVHAWLSVYRCMHEGESTRIVRMCVRVCVCTKFGAHLCCFLRKYVCVVCS